jgi:acetylornithine deacetylase/succinyl-diaminopimelate desuccinylase-like protein
MNAAAARSFIEQTWTTSIVPALREYITIPNQSPAFDPHWREHGHMDRAVDLIVRWVVAQRVAGLTLEVVRLPGRTPLIWLEVPGASDDTVLLYGHLDKQPPLDGWSDGLGAWTPVIRDGKLYGRGGADDGYAAFACVAAVQALQAQRLAHARCVILIEACEESGSGDLPAYIDALADRIGTPSLVICLDSGCGNYDQLWITTSLRGLVNGMLTVTVLREGVHSGGAGGIVPSSFRIARALLSRLEDERSGAIRLPALYVDIPGERLTQAAAAAAALGASVHTSLPFVAGAAPVSNDITELLLNNTWRPQLEVIGAAGLPAPEHAGNVLRPQTTLKLSLRLPPTLDAGNGGRPLLRCAHRRSAVGRARDLLSAAGDALEPARAAPGTVAGGIRGARVARFLWPGPRLSRRGRHDPVHGHARGALPARPVHHYRRPRPALERARPERVSRARHRGAAHRVRRAGARRPLRGGMTCPSPVSISANGEVRRGPPADRRTSARR